MIDKPATLKSAMRIERLLGGEYKAYIGQAMGVAKSEAKAKALCEEAALDILEHTQSARIEVRSGYLIISQVDSSTSAWYTIQRLSDLASGGDRMIYSCCCMSPHSLKQAIDSHLAQYIADDVR